MILQQIHKAQLADCQRIQKVLWDRGIDERLPTCRCLWEHISYIYYRTSWHPLPETDEELFKIISDHAEIQD